MTTQVQQQPTPLPPPLLTPQQAAEYLGVSKSFLDKCRVRGDGPRFRKMRRRVGYSYCDLRDWLDSNAHFSTSSVGVQ
ncbi:helix-turn-helix domain-containing protein [Sphingomonas lutea]|uniref:Helix-turn-helix domain-containing protein n=2 Tax=Sphingomonas lutea TaxID=1045317 RepID=A0A7G9SFI5_9SPHN|nr:helix-turn-helix domain-containing protein [Sphingomonas lutea]